VGLSEVEPAGRKERGEEVSSTSKLTKEGEEERRTRRRSPLSESRMKHGLAGARSSRVPRMKFRGREDEKVEAHLEVGVPSVLCTLQRRVYEPRHSSQFREAKKDQICTHSSVCASLANRSFHLASASSSSLGMGCSPPSSSSLLYSSCPLASNVMFVDVSGTRPPWLL
jgi:hypothetical protein